MRTFLTPVVLATLAVPASPFQIVMMANYLDKLGGGSGGKPAAKAAWKPWKPPQPAAPEASVPPPPPQQPPEPTTTSQPPPQQPLVADPEEPVMQAMSELTETFVQNEAATLLALKEISSSMKLLAEQGGIGGGAPPQPAEAEAKPVVLPPPVPSMPSREELAAPAETAPTPPPAPPAPAPEATIPEPAAPTPTVAFSGSSVWGTTPSSEGSYLENIAGSSGPVKAATYMPRGKPEAPKGTGSYLDSVAGATMVSTPVTPAAPSPVVEATPVAPSPAESAPTEAAPAEPAPAATTPAPPKPAPTPPAPVANTGTSGVGVSLGLTVFGLGLLFALAGGGGDYVKNQFDFPQLSFPPVQEEETVAPGAVSSNTVVVPEPAAPDSPAAPEQAAPESSGPMQGIFDRVMGAITSSPSKTAEEAAPVPEASEEAVPDETQIPVPENPVPAQTIYEKIMGTTTPPSESAEEAAPVPEAPEGAIPDENQFPVPENLAPAQTIYEKIMGIVPAEEAAKEPEAAAPEPEMAAPDVVTPDAEVPPPEPEMAVPEPDKAAPDMVAPKPEVPPPVPDVAAPDVAAPEPEATESPSLVEAQPETPPVPGAPSEVTESPPVAEAQPETPPVPGAPSVVLGAGAAVGAAATAASPAVAAAPAVARTGPSTYSYDPGAIDGPSAWSTLNIEGNECGGEKQSPIGITPSPCNIGANYKMETTSSCSVSDLDYALGRGGPKASFPKQCGGSTIQIPVLEGIYEAVQFHTHIGSEHVIGGKRAGAELHIVHKEQGGSRFAVVGIMVNGDSKVDNPTFGRLLDKWTAVENAVAANCNGIKAPTKNRPFVSDSTFNVYDLVPLGSAFYHYDGSLTTPPCSEVVWWEVADTPLSISPAQYERLVKMTTTYTDPATCEVKTAASPLDGSTNRPIAQDISGRKVQRICPVGSLTPGLEPPPVVLSSDAPLYAEPAPGASAAPAVEEQAPANAMTEQPLAEEDPYVGL